MEEEGEPPGHRAGSAAANDPAVADAPGESAEAGGAPAGVTWSATMESHLIRSLAKFRPVGVHKHFRMIGLHDHFNRANDSSISTDQLWQKLASMYDLAYLDEMDWENGHRLEAPPVATLASRPSSETLRLSGRLSVRSPTTPQSPAAFADFDLPLGEFHALVSERRAAVEPGDDGSDLGERPSRRRGRARPDVPVAESPQIPAASLPGESQPPAARAGRAGRRSAALQSHRGSGAAARRGRPRGRRRENETAALPLEALGEADTSEAPSSVRATEDDDDSGSDTQSRTSDAASDDAESADGDSNVHDATDELAGSDSAATRPNSRIRQSSRATASADSSSATSSPEASRRRKRARGAPLPAQPRLRRGRSTSKERPSGDNEGAAAAATLSESVEPADAPEPRTSPAASEDVQKRVRRPARAAKALPVRRSRR